MTKVPSLSYHQIVRALQRDGWTVVRQRGSHIRLQKRLENEVSPTQILIEIAR